MAFIKVNNDHNQILIDDNFQNYQHVITGTYSFFLREGQYWRQNPTPFTYTGHANSKPMIAVLSDGGGTVPIVVSVSRSGNNFSFTFRGRIGSEAQNGRILVFDTPPANQVATGLIKVRDANGKITFDSDRKYMKVIGVIGANQTLNVPTNSAVAYASITMGYARIASMGMTGYQFASTFVKSSNNGLRLTTEHKYFASQLGNAPAPPSGWPSRLLLGTLMALVIDANGLV